MSNTKYILILSVIFILATSAEIAFGYTSYVFTLKNVVFFSYEDNTQVELYKTNGEQVLPPTTLNKG